MRSALALLTAMITLGAIWYLQHQPMESKPLNQLGTAETPVGAPTKTPAAAADLAVTVGSASSAIVSKQPEDAASLPAFDGAAIASLRATIEGDPRAPAIDQDVPQRVSPDAAILASPTRYREWQGQRRLERYGSYVEAAGERLAEMEEQIEYGRANGVSEAQLRMAEEKRERLAQARTMLLEKHPELATPPPLPEN